jgi:hypothetical protein
MAALQACGRGREGRGRGHGRGCVLGRGRAGAGHHGGSALRAAVPQLSVGLVLLAVRESMKGGRKRKRKKGKNMKKFPNLKIFKK